MVKCSQNNCQKAAKVFFRVHYSELHVHCQNGLYEDVFGFCAECAKGKDKAEAYKGSSRTCPIGFHKRGIVSAVEPSTESECLSQREKRSMHDAKKEFLRIMSTKGHAKFANEWPKIFELAWQEFCIKRVHES